MVVVTRSLIWVIALLLILSGGGCSSREGLQGYLEGEYINLATNYSGILKQLLVLRGDWVKQGQLLFVLDPEPEASQLAQAQAQLAQAQKRLLDLENGQRQTVLESIAAQRDQAAADLVLSTKNLQRYTQLFQQGAISKLTLDEAQATYQRNLNSVNEYKANLAEAKLGARENAIAEQQAAVVAAAAAVKTASWELAQKSVYAPTEGRIFDTFYKVGEFVNNQQPVAALLSPRDIKVIFYIPEPKRSTITIGQVLYFDCDGCKTRGQAKITYISPIAEYTPPVIFSRESRQKLVYRVEAHLPWAEALRFYPGQPVDVYFK
jgi:HlyD family secretion protein